MNIPEHLLGAVNDFLEGKASPEDRILVMEWIDKLAISEKNKLLMYEGNYEELKQHLLNRVLNKIDVELEPVSFRKLPWYRYAAAAAVIFALASGTFFLLNSKKRSHTDIASVAPKINLPEENAPGKEGAVLTLADGSVVVLDSLSNGIIANQPGTQVVLNNGSLAYDPIGNKAGETVYNILTTPKGRHFQIVLADGTKVWMNAASSVKFPTIFNGNKRKVEMTGEVYFEVAKNTAMPFLVKINEQAEVEVLGTQFNINSYEDEGEIKTTLLEGSIRLSNDIAVKRAIPETVVLEPGQQARMVSSKTSQNINGGAIKNSKTRIIISKADTEKVMAWKNGLFNFENASLEEVMRQLSRWYDIEVVYEKEIPEIYFAGEVSRNISLEGLLKGLERARVHFRKEGKRLVVLP